jgi:hypothetical protein
MHRGANRFHVMYIMLIQSLEIVLICLIEVESWCQTFHMNGNEICLG